MKPHGNDNADGLAAASKEQWEVSMQSSVNTLVEEQIVAERAAVRTVLCSNGYLLRLLQAQFRNLTEQHMMRTNSK